MKPKEYKDKCSELLAKFEQLINQEPDGSVYKGADQLLREFRHLVYAFDPNLPLNKELDEPNALRLYTAFYGKEAHEGSIIRIREFMNFFINYIDNYCV